MLNAKTVIVGISVLFCVLLLGVVLMLPADGTNEMENADSAQISGKCTAVSQEQTRNAGAGEIVGGDKKGSSHERVRKQGSKQPVEVEPTNAEDALKGFELEALVSESLRVYNEYDRVTTEMEAATSDLNGRHKPIRDRIAWLKEPAFDEERAYDVNRNIRFYKNQVTRLETFIEIAKISDPDERAKLFDKYEADRVRLLAEEQEAGRPYSKRLDELKAKVESKQSLFEEAMKAYCLLPKKKYAELAGTTATAAFHTGTVKYEWLDGEDKQLARASVKLKKRPPIKDDAIMLDEKFYVTQHYRIDMTIRTGHFEVTLNVIKPEWQGKEKIAELIRDLVDLDGLAKIDPTRSETSVNALVKDSLLCLREYGRIVRERNEITGPLADARVNAKSFKRRLSEPPVDSEQLEKDRNSLENYRLDVEREQARLEVGRIADSSKRAEILAGLESEHKSLLAEKNRIAKPYYDKQRELRSGLENKTAALDAAMKGHLLMGGKAYPGAQSISTRTIFYKGEVSCNWKDGIGKTLCYAGLRVRNRPVIPKDARMLDDRYYISEIVNNCIRVWAGNFEVGFCVDVDKRDWHGEDRIGDVLKHFVDLAGLAKIE